MRVLKLLLVMLAAPVAAESAPARKVVGFGEPIVMTDKRTESGVRFALTNASLSRRIYLVDKIDLPASSRLFKDENSGEYCSEGVGYKKSGDTERGICLVDEDADGTFDILTGREIARPTKLKDKIPYSIQTGDRNFPLPIVKRLVYLGGGAGEIKLSYREFTRDGLARPAFTEDLTIPVGSFPADLTIKGFKLTVYGQSASGLDVGVVD